jgi:hypothetical protein
MAAVKVRGLLSEVRGICEQLRLNKNKLRVLNVVSASIFGKYK